LSRSIHPPLYNNLFKYTDDTTLLVPEHGDVDIDTEFGHVHVCALHNTLCINTIKTKDSVLHQPRARSHYMVLSIDDVERVAFQGLSTAQLDQVSEDIIVSRLRYAPPVCSGFLTADLINRIQALLKRLFKFGYSSHLISFSDVIKSCSEDLFENGHKSNHCLHELFSSYVHQLESLRPQGHDLMLPACTGYLYKQSFIIKSLFEFFLHYFCFVSCSAL